MNDQTATVTGGETGEEISPRLFASPSALTLAVGFALYVFVQVGMVLGPIITRPVPPGTTDAYVYIAKAVQLGLCPRQDCPALKDFRVQTAPEAGLAGDIARRRSLAHQRGLLQYHLVHSGLLYGLHAAGLSYELALNALSVAGAVLVACAVAWLLVATFGLGPAGLALALLAFAVYPGYHGLHWMVPSTMALGIGLLAWAAVIARVRGAVVLVPLLLLLAAWMHPIGSVYGAAALALHALLVPWRKPRGWVVLALGAIAIASPLILGHIVDRPTLSFRGFHADAGWDYWSGIRKNLNAAWWAVRPWLNERGGAPLLALAALGLALAASARHRVVLVLPAVAGGLALASLVYVLPPYPAEMFHRTFVPFAIVTTGTAAFAVWRSVALFVSPRDTAGRSGFSGAMRSAAGLSVRIVAVALVGVAAALAALGGIVNGSRASLGKARYMTAWGVMPLDRSQPSRVLAGVAKDARIAYFDELSFYFYASRGGLDRPAAYGPAIIGTALAERYYGANARVALSVRARDGFYGYVELQARRPIVIRAAKPIDWSQVRLNLWVTGKAPSFDVRLLGEAGSVPVKVTLDKVRLGWNALGLPAGTKGRALVIMRRKHGPLAWIQGVRLAPDAKPVWPWDAGVTILQWKLPARMERVMARLAKAPGETPDAKTVSQHRFETEMLTPPGCRHLRVVADFGATVASRIECGVAPAARPAKPAKPRRRSRR